MLAVTNPIGKIQPSIPLLITPAIDASGKLVGVISLLNSLLKIAFVIAGLFAFINIILAGYGFINAGGDSKKVADAWAKIWQSIVGLIIIVFSFLIAAIVGVILFRDPTAILQPRL